MAAANLTTSEKEEVGEMSGRRVGSNPSRGSSWGKAGGQSATNYTVNEQSTHLLEFQFSRDSNIRIYSVFLKVEIKISEQRVE